MDSEQPRSPDELLLPTEDEQNQQQMPGDSVSETSNEHPDTTLSRDTSDATDQVVQDLENVGDTISNRLHDIGRTAAEQQQNNLLEVVKTFITTANGVKVQYGYLENKDQDKTPFTNIILDMDPIDLSKLAGNQAMEINLGLPSDASLSASVTWEGMKSAVSKVVVKLPLSRASTDDLFKGRNDVPPMLQKALDDAFVEDTLRNLPEADS